MRVPDVETSVSEFVCDPPGKFVVRAFVVNTDQCGMEIWALPKDEVSFVDALPPRVNRALALFLAIV